MTKYINAMGVEIEGGWDNGQPSNLRPDGSVSVSADYVGESVSHPFRRFAGLSSFIRDNYPDTFNGSCGMHVHVSLNSNGMYSRLMDREFLAFFLDTMKLWGRKNDIKSKWFWERIEGRNRYCTTRWNADTQSRLDFKDNPRYCAWNFCHRLRGTAECRVLPVLDNAALAVMAVAQIRRCVGLWLSKHNPEGKAVIATDEAVPAQIVKVETLACRPFEITPVVIKEETCV